MNNQCKESPRANISRVKKRPSHTVKKDQKRNEKKKKKKEKLNVMNHILPPFQSYRLAFFSFFVFLFSLFF